MKEKLHKENSRKKVVVSQKVETEEVLDFKGEKYQQRRVVVDICKPDGDKIACYSEGNVLALKGAVEIKSESIIYFYKNFFAVCVHNQEWDKIMGILDEETYNTQLYTYKGLHLESISGVWSQNPAAVDAFNNKAYLYDKDREELEGEAKI